MRPYDASAANSREVSFKPPPDIVTVRPERGYSATFYDDSPARSSKTLRWEFGQKYDPKKVRNNLYVWTNNKNVKEVLHSLILGCPRTVPVNDVDAPDG